MDEESLRNRMRAARAIAGLSVEQLADCLQGEGLSAKTLGAIERGERVARPMELRTIAAACGLPYEFFTAEFDALASGRRQDDETIHDLAERVAKLEESMDAVLELIRHDVVPVLARFPAGPTGDESESGAAKPARTARATRSRRADAQ